MSASSSGAPAAASDRLAAAVEALADLVAFPTVSDRPNRGAVEWIAQRLERCGARTVLSPDATGEKANLLATIGPERPGGVVLSGHIDVVPEGDRALWTGDPFRLRACGERLYGRGAVDMKGFLACVLASAPLFARAPLARPVIVAVTYDEEVGCWGAQALVEAWRAHVPRPAACIVGEPSGMDVVDAHKGSFDYTTRFLGRGGGHASTPPDGMSAVAAAALFAAEIHAIGVELRADPPPTAPFDPPWTTLQVGRIEGGSARNVLPGAATIDWEIRPAAAADAARAKARLAALAADRLSPEMRRAAPDARIETIVHGEAPALERAPDNVAADLAERLTGRPGRRAVSFGAEAGIYQADGVPSVICGPGSIAQAHIVDEFVERAQLALCLAAFERLADALAA